jgi:hypothetical protein
MSNSNINRVVHKEINIKRSGMLRCSLWSSGLRITSEAHPAFYPMGTWGLFPGSKTRPGRDADHSPHLVQRSRMSRMYISSPPWRQHGVAGQLYLTENINLHHCKHQLAHVIEDLISVYTENRKEPISTKCRLTDCCSRWYIQLRFGFNQLMTVSVKRQMLVLLVNLKGFGRKRS